MQNENEKLPETTLETGKTGYDKLQEEMDKRSSYLKFVEGDTIVIPQAELYELELKKIDFGDGKPKETYEFPVKLEDGTIKNWSLSPGGKKGAFGKLLAIGKAKGSLKGRKIRVTRQGLTKDDTVYTIIEVK